MIFDDPDFPSALPPQPDLKAKKPYQSPDKPLFNFIFPYI